MYDESAYKVQVRVYPMLLRKLDRKNQILVEVKNASRIVPSVFPPGSGQNFPQ